MGRPKKHKTEEDRRLANITNCKQYYLDNKNKILAQQKLKYNSNKDKILSKQKEYYSNNKEVKLVYQKDYAVKNKLRIKAYKDSYDKSLKAKSGKKYYLNNKITHNAKNYKRKVARLKSDKLFKLRENISSLIRNSFNNKNYSKKSKTVDVLGCTYEYFKEYLESKFESWMTWDNHGLYNGTEGYGWDIDHIVPLSSANTETELLKLCHYTNLQPLCSLTNRYIKRDRIL